jgi:aminoglycoside/choline kinase family phosphotransferase
MPRTTLLRNWLGQVFESAFPGWDVHLEAASADASFRRYFRVLLPDQTTRIVMDAPPEKEDCRPFIQVAALFRGPTCISPRSSSAISNKASCCSPTLATPLT